MKEEKTMAKGLDKMFEKEDRDNLLKELSGISGVPYETGSETEKKEVKEMEPRNRGKKKKKKNQGKSDSLRRDSEREDISEYFRMINAPKKQTVSQKEGSPIKVIEDADPEEKALVDKKATLERDIAELEDKKKELEAERDKEKAILEKERAEREREERIQRENMKRLMEEGPSQDRKQGKRPIGKEISEEELAELEKAERKTLSRTLIIKTRESGHILSVADDMDVTEGSGSLEHYLIEKETGEIIELNEDFYTIGRDPSCSLLINKSVYVGRHHAELRREGYTFTLSDNDSTNGTFINKRRLQPGTRSPLKEGDEIRFADVVFQFN